MKAWIFFMLAMMFVATPRAQPVEPTPLAQLLGEWWTPGFSARVRIEACGDAVCGRIVWAWDETPKDIVDKRTLVGRKVIEGMRADAGNRWTGGRLYNPEDGQDYKGLLHLQSPSRLSVEGCVLFICKQQLWRRAEPSLCTPAASASPAHKTMIYNAMNYS